MRPKDPVTLAHGGGGRLSRELVARTIAARLGNPVLDPLSDAALLPAEGSGLAFTTDGYVVRPPFFPGGDIGRLAVCGTVNDLAVSGAAARWLSLALIIEEGLPLADLERVLESVRAAAAEAGAVVATGDTKVVERGAADRIFAVTSGIGVRLPGFELGPGRVRPGDMVIVSGTLGDHGAAVMLARQGLDFSHPIVSDTAPLAGMVGRLAPLASLIRFMRDPTRGGLAATLNELVTGAGFGIWLSEEAIPVRPEVAAAFEILGLDPLHAANEGKLVAVVAPEAAEAALGLIRGDRYGAGAAIIGRATEEHPGRVFVENGYGGRRLVSMPEGELLPRIC